VSWSACVQLLARVGLLLPSEAQWEYGCRAGTHTRWWPGAERDDLRRAGANLADQAALRAGAPWVEVQDWPELDDGYAVHAPIGTFSSNAFGLHEVHGNVWEWCRDGHRGGGYPAGPAVDPLQPPEGAPARIARGGSFFDVAAHARCASRLVMDAADTSNGIGLRPARPVDP
jgi:formylglycine-generating enzyme required for sulfatase activity